MIQRVQSIYLLVAGATMSGVFLFPLWSTELPLLGPFNFMASEYALLTGGAIGISALALLAIFLFKNRPLQSRLALFVALLALFYHGLIYMQSKELDVIPGFSDSLSISLEAGGVMPFLCMIFAFLAYRGIGRDEKLVRSMDRLR
jgi:hypothetical protein